MTIWPSQTTRTPCCERPHAFRLWLRPAANRRCTFPTLEAWFGVESLVEHAGFRPLFALPSEGDIELTEDLLTLMADASPITHLTVDDPPIYLSYAIPNLPVDEETSPNVWVHHPMFGIELKAQMDVLGIECHVWYPGGPSVDAYASQEAFLVEILTQP